MSSTKTRKSSIIFAIRIHPLSGATGPRRYNHLNALRPSPKDQFILKTSLPQGCPLFLVNVVVCSGVLQGFSVQTYVRAQDKICSEVF